MHRLLLTLALIATWAILYGQSIPKRTLNYRPEGRAFVCVNGQNRFTRALYGSHTAYRIETCDRPEFAVTDGKWGDHIQFRAFVGKRVVPLESAEYCEARYIDGRRDYLVRDARLGKGQLRISVLACPDKEGGVWEFTAEGLEEPLRIEGRLCRSKAKKFVRFGDMGRMEEPGCYDPPAEPVYTSVASTTLHNDTGHIAIEGEQLVEGDHSDTYMKGQAYWKNLSATVTFDTPDPYMNTLGSALVLAADGAWNGQVWCHGAVGWRMPLPGWRAAYIGDFIGMFDRQITHFNAYAKSQVTDVPVTLPHLMDKDNNLARGAYEWGTPMYSDGYICRNPENNHQFHHYDMNLVYIDELLWHFQFDADTTYMRQMWPVITRHLAWEKNCWNPDGDHLYDAYCCIWASDALQYNSGAVTHSSAYNYRGNLLAARVAELIGEDPTPYRHEAEAILHAMNERLWLQDKGHWAEYQDFMGQKRTHEDAAVWSIYTPIDCGACTPLQAYQAMQYVSTSIPHIPFQVEGEQHATISTSDWQPYEWSINNVAMAEVMHTTLAYYQAGRTEEAYRLLKSNVLDFMYTGGSPANFGQISHFDRVLGESYRDFSDCTGIAARTLIEGLYGITPEAMQGRCIIRPGFPAHWKNASIHTPYLDYTFERHDGKDTYTIHQRFRQPLQIVIRQNKGQGEFIDHVFSSDTVQTITLPTLRVNEDDDNSPTTEATATTMATATTGTPSALGNDFDQVESNRCQPIDICTLFNAHVTDIFKNQYLSPRSPYTTLCLPTQGIGDWCSTKRTADIDDTEFRSLSQQGTIHLLDIPFLTPSEGKNVIYTSLWDNYPDSITIPMQGRASHLYLMMVGSTNPMQSHFQNAVIRVTYTDGTNDLLELRNPDNWCPIEQDYDEDGHAFSLPHPRPYRFALASGTVSRTLAASLAVEPSAAAADLPEGKRPLLQIKGGAGQLLDMPVNPSKKLKCITLTTTANDVVVGLMGITLQK